MKKVLIELIVFDRIRFFATIVSQRKRDVVFVITGARRSGKTYFLYEIAKKLRRKLPPQNIIYINFEDDRLYPLKGDELRNLPEVYFEYFPPDENSPVWFLLDEIQNIPNWERSQTGREA